MQMMLSQKKKRNPTLTPHSSPIHQKRMKRKKRKKKKQKKKSWQVDE